MMFWIGLTAGIVATWLACVVYDCIRFQRSLRPYEGKGTDYDVLAWIEKEVETIDLQREILADRVCDILGHTRPGTREFSICRSVVMRSVPVHDALGEIMEWKKAKQPDGAATRRLRQG